MIQSIQSSIQFNLAGAALILGLLLTIYGLVNQLRNVANIVWHSDSNQIEEIDLWGNLKIVALLLFLAAAWFLFFVLGYLSSLLNPTGVLLQIQNSLAIPLQIGINALAFALFLQALVSFRILWKHLAAAGIGISILFQGGTQVFRYYFDVLFSSPIYGAAGSFALLLVWVFYSTQIFLLGMELTKSLHYRRIRRLQDEQFLS
jgi:membrane protein